MPRPDGRSNDQLRPLVLERGANPYAEGSCLIRMGGTLVHCTASVETGVPGFKKGTGEGWVTAEYAMLPRATVERTSRERNGPGGRTQEIQRLIGRSLRAAMGTMAFGEYTIRIDCDVLQADGGTRTASITGGCVALADACAWLAERTGMPSPFGSWWRPCRSASWTARRGSTWPTSRTATRSVDANVVMLEPDRFVEVQGTGEHGSFSRAPARPAARSRRARASPSSSGAAHGARLVKLLAATRSAGKQREIRRLLEAAGFEVVFPDEVGLCESPARRPRSSCGDSLRGERARKAEYFAELTGLPTVADDSGLEVFVARRRAGRALPALGRARRARRDEVDAANNAELLRRLRGRAEAAAARALSLRARAICASLGAMPEVFEGACAGRILEAPRGHRRASATIRSSSATTSARASARRTGGEGRGEPPRPGLPMPSLLHFTGVA